MLRLIYSNRLDELSDPLVAAVRAARGCDPLEPVVVMIPNRAVEQFVRFRVAEALGVAASLDFVFLERFVAELLEKTDDKLRVLTADDLRLAIFERLRTGRFEGEPELEPLLAYLRHGSPEPGQVELRAFQLAGKAARFLQEYAFSRREMVIRWPQNLRFAGKPAADVERWQRRLWLALFDANGAARIGEGERMFLPDAFAAVDPAKLPLPASLHVFALSNVAPEFIRIFATLARKTDLHVYALNPCLEFWEDVDTSWGLVAERLVHRRPRIGNVFATDSDDPFGLLSSDDTPALRLWGRPGREHVRLFNELTDCDHEPRFVRSGCSTMLARLQDDILCRAPERKPGEAAAASLDPSIRLLACPGIRREAEIVGEEIWRLVREKPAADTKLLRFHEIAVLYPDRAAEAYLPHVESVFARLHDIPVNVVQSRLGGESRLVEAVELLLALPFSKLGRHEVLQVLTHPAVIGSRTDIDPDRWREWARELGVVLGGNRDDLAGTYIARDLYNWDQALRRLAAGAFLAGEASGEKRRFGGDERPLLPHEIGGDDVAVAAELVRLARALLSDVRACRSASLTLAEWVDRLTALVLQYVEAPNSIEERARSRCLEVIQSIAVADLPLGPVSYPVVHEMIREAMASVAERRGVLFGSGVAVGSLSTLRSLPFRVVFVLGLGEGEFPRGESLDPLDLRTARRQPGDVSATERDRYLFLEALLGARERLFLSWVSRNPQTGEERKRSTVVSELEYVLRGYTPDGKVDGLTISYPVSRYEPSSFPEIEPEEAEPAADDEGRRNARVAVARRKLLEHTGVQAFPFDRRDVWNLLTPKARAQLAPALGMPSLAGAITRRASTAAGPEEITLSLSALRRFLECPLQGSVRAVLGLPGDDEPDDERPEEPLVLSNLDRTIVLRDAFHHAGGDPEEAQRLLVEGLALRELRGLAPTGPFGDAARTGCEQTLQAWAGAVEPTRWQDVRIGQAEEFEEVDALLPPIVLDLAIDPPRGDRSAKRREIRLTLHGKVDAISPEGDRILRCVARDAPSPRDILNVHFAAMALAAAGHALAPSLDLRVVCTDSAKIEARSFRTPARASARRYLAGLARELFARVHDYFFPLEVVTEFYWSRRKKTDRKTLAEIIEVVRGEANSSNYGPVRDAVDFPAPPDAKAIIDRRFEPLFGFRLG